MESLILDNISLIILLPLWIFLIIMCGRFFSVYVNKGIIYILTLLSSLLGVAACSFSLLNLSEAAEKTAPFINIKEFTISFGLSVDKLSLIMALVLYVVSFAVQLYSLSYMKDEKKSYKFFAYLNLFNFAMASLLFSPNLFQFYVFWELVGAVSYLLIGFDYKDEVKSKASKRVFLMNRVGDTAFLAGIILTSYYMFSYAENYSFASQAFEDMNASSTLLMAYTSTPLFCMICGLFIVAAAVKSAQFPFYTWLQDAMEAKTPVSALLHSATMVAAGVYLIIKMMPFFTLNPFVTKFILVIGLLTAIICSLLASIETHPKKILAYSTSANYGFMFMALGAVNIKIALIIFIAHAFIKSALFILLPKEKGMSKSGFILLVISALSLAGLVFAGVGTKEILYKSFEFYALIPYVLLFTGFVSAYYITRFVILVYKNSEINLKTDYVELFSYLILFFANAGLYVILLGTYHLAEPFAAATGGIALALLLGKNNCLEKLNKTPKLLEKFYNDIVSLLYAKISQGLSFADTNILANYKPVLFISKLFVKITNWIETNVMNKSVSFVSSTFKWISKRDMLMQSGNVQTYNAYAFIMAATVIALVIVGYTLLFG